MADLGHGKNEKINKPLELVNGTNINEFSIDGTLAGNSDNVVPTEQAVKTYINIRSLVISRLTSPVTSVTGDATAYTLLCNEVKDIDNEYVTGTGTITIKKKGIYTLNSIMKFTGVNVGETNTRVISRFVTTPETIITCDKDDGIATASGNLTINGSAMREFSVNDTIKLEVLVQGGASKNVGIGAGSYFTSKLEVET